MITPADENIFITDVKKLLQCERALTRADITSLERKLLRAETILLILAVITIVVVSSVHIAEGLPEAGTLLPNMGLAALRMRLRG